MASGLASIGKRRALEKVRERAQESKTASGLASIGKRSDDEKNRGGLIGGIGYVAGSLGLGLAGVGEGVLDIATAAADLTRGNTDMAKYRFLDNRVGQAQQRLREDYNPGAVMEFAGDVASGIGQSSVFLLDAVAPGVGTGLFFAGVGGHGISSAAQQTGDVGWKELGYGAASGATEALLEKALGAGSKVAGKLGASITRRAGTAIGQKGITTALTKSVGKRAWSSIAKATAKDAAGEFAEEFASEYIDSALLQAFGIDPNASTSFGEAVRAGMVGLFSGGIMGAPGNVINYKNAAKAGRAIRESGETENLLNRAQATVSVLREQEAVKNAESKKAKKTDEGTEAAEKKGFLARQGAKQEARRAKEYAVKLEKNIKAYRELSEGVRSSEVGDALLGELRGNLYFTNMAYAVEEAEIVLRNVDDAQAQKIVDYINTEAKKAKQKKSDYTVEDFRLNRDGILSQFAAKGRMEQLINGEWTEAEEMAAQAAEATESPVEAAGAAGAVTGEEVSASEQAAHTEESEGSEGDPWESVEGVKGFGTQNKQEEDLLRAAASHGVPKRTVPAMLNSFREGTDMTPAEFADAWADGVMLFGRLGLNEATINEESGLARMSEKARKASIREGRVIADEETKRAQDKSEKKKLPARNKADAKRLQEGRGTIIKGKGLIVKDLSPEQYSAYKAAEVFAAVLGTDIVIETDIKTEGGKRINGYYDTATNTIHINISAERSGQSIALYTLGHEATHYIKEWSPEKFRALSDFVMEHLGKDASSMISAKADFLRKMPDYKDYTVTQLNDLAAEEVVADGMELILTDGRVLDELAKTDKSLWEKVRDWIKNTVAKIRKYYGELNQASKTAQVLKETVESLEEIEQLFYEGVTEAGERTRTAGEVAVSDGERRYSIDETAENADISENETDTAYISAEDQNLLFDTDFYERYENESRELITETVEELEAAKASEAFATMSDDEMFDLNAKLKAKRAGYNTVYDYYVETEKKRMAEEYRRYLQTGRSNRTSRTLEEKRKKAQKERTLRSDEASATPLQNAQYKIIQETNPMWDEYHTGIRSPKEIKTFAEVAEDPDSFTWGDFTREDARKALRDGTVRVYSSYAIKNGVFVSTSYNQALQYAGNNPDGVHTRVVALDSVAWINGDEGQYAKVYKDDGIRYSIDETSENADVYENRDLTDRELLGMALEGAVQSQEEFDIIKSYREQASMLEIVKEKRNGYSKEAAALEKQIKDLRARMDEEGDPNGFVRKAMDEAIIKKREAEKMRDEQAGILDDSTRELLRLKAAKPFRELLAREQKRVRAAERRAERAEEVAERRVERARDSADKRVERAKAEYEAREEYKADRREMSVRERVARRVIGRLNTMFYSPSRTKHVPADLQALVEQVLRSEKLDTFKETRKNLRQMAELERDIEKLEQNPARTASEQERLDKLHYKYAMLEDEGLDAKGQAEALYTAFKTWMESRPEGQKDKALLDKLSSEIDKMQEMPLSMMSKKSLEAVEDFYKMIYHQVNTANQIYTTERVLYVDDLGGKASQEAQDTKSLKFLSPKAMEIKGKDSIRRFFWKNMKPLTVFEAIGSKTFTDLFQAVLDGEGVWAKDILEARAKIVAAREAHKYKDWDLEKRVEVKTKEGTVKLSLAERMSLYAYAKRAQAVSHLEGGGFVLDPKATTKEGKTLAGIALERRLNDSNRYVLDETLMGDIASTLTAEQKAYVDEMQTYLTQLGKKGNEVSRKLYGMDIFNEEFYFPIKVKSEYLASQTGKTGDPNIKNRGMTKEVVPEAEDPLVLQGFDEVMADHINSMATYHAFVLPVEDLTRVLNYKPANYLRDEKGEVILDDTGKPKADPDAAKDYSTLKAVIEDKYGADAVKYIEQVIRDLNGGARRDAAAGILDRGLTAFKRASTMASLSVLVQQPTSLIRAAAYIEPKYLFGNAAIIDFKNHKELWERVKKYAPVAVIKEMGGYDTGVGTRTADYLNATEYGKGERLKGFVKDESYRAEVFGKGAAYADEMAWIQMFEACVSEQADKLGKARDSEEVLQAAGKRFEEVIRHTQVYDSTLTRSENMRSKDTGMKMATAFMAEPTTIVSMVAEAVMKAERGDKTFLRNTAAAVAGSIILNSIAASLVYALRDDDEDETYGEKYVSNLAMEVADGFNPLGYLPVARDVVSLMQGYEVERTDMALIGNLIDQVNMITSSKRSVSDKVFGVSGAVSAFFGVPVTNLYRDAKGAINTVLNATSPEATTGAGVSAAVKKEFTTIFGLFDEQTRNGYQLYKAYVDGDTAHYNRVKARYEDEKAAEQALRKELRENDRRIAEAAQAKLEGDLESYEAIVERITGEGIFDRSMVVRAVNNEVSALKQDAEKGNTVPKAETEEEMPDEALYTATDLNAAIDRGDRADIADVYEYLLAWHVDGGKTEAQARSSIKSSITSYWKKRYLAAWQSNDTKEIKRIQEALTATGLYGSYNEVAKLGQEWVKAYTATR